MAVQSRLLPSWELVKMKAMERAVNFAVSYSQNYTNIQRGLTVFYFTGLTIGFAMMFAPRKSKGGAKNHEVTLRKGRGRRGGSNAPRVAVDNVFFKRLGYLLRILFPSWHCKEMGLLISFTLTLIIRTMLSLYVADLDGRIVASLVRGERRSFFRNVLMWMGIAVPAVFTNSMISYLSSSMALAFRVRLTDHIQHRYLENLTFYKLTNLDDRVKNADQLVTVDVQLFSRALATLYGNIALPLLDVFLYNAQLMRTVGAEMMIGTTIIIRLTTILLQKLTPPFGQYAATEQQLEGEYRFSHARLIENSEEVGFYRGQELEKHLIDRCYFSLIKHINRVFHIRIGHGMMEEGVVKWLWGAIGLIICSAPVFFRIPGMSMGGGGGGGDMGSRTKLFVTNRRLLLSSSDAMGRIMYSYKELSELAGYTARLAELIDVMNDVEKGKAQKRLVSSGSEEEKQKKADVFNQRGVIDENSDEVIFDQVPIVSPNGDVLLEKLSFHIKPGQHLLIIGPNGCGKSSMFRILGGLWPVLGGKVTKPPNTQFTYIPQRPYLSLGTLRDQITYPDTVDEMHAKGVTDEDLFRILELLQIQNIVEREGGWEVKREWRDALSGGDKQRIAMARLFYHKPKYAILDECTSAVTLEIERIMYDHATELGITMMTVSHRPSLWKYHSHVLQYDGQGGYVFTELDADKRLELQEEKQQLEQKLLLMPKWQERSEELRAILARLHSKGVKGPNVEELKGQMITEANKAEASKTEANKAEAPKPEAPKAEAPKAEAPKAEAPKAEAPKTETPKPEVPKTEKSKAEAPKADAPHPEAPKPKAPKAETPKAEAPKAEAAKSQSTKAKTEATKDTKAGASKSSKKDTASAKAAKAEASKAEAPKAAPAAQPTAQPVQNEAAAKAPQAQAPFGQPAAQASAASEPAAPHFPPRAGAHIPGQPSSSGSGPAPPINFAELGGKKPPSK